MHPLEKPVEFSLDVNTHRSRGVVRRRSSLDNSCLSASEIFASSVLPGDKIEFAQKARRLSLGAKLEGCCINTTFLAVNKTPSETRETKVDLDADGHDSNYSPTNRSRPSWHSKASKASDTINTSSVGSLDIMMLEEEHSGDDESDSSFADDDDSDCDSFCDASVGEPANRNYLRQELGASVFWGEDSNGDMDTPPIHDSFSSGKRRVFTPAPRQVLPRSFSTGSGGLSGGSASSPRRAGRRLQVSLQVTEETMVPAGADA